MKLDLQLYVRRHRNGFFTVRVLGDRNLELYTDDLDQAKEDLELVVSDLVDRSHPRRQSTFAPAVSADAQTIEAPELLEVHDEEGIEKAPMAFTALVSSESWQNVWLPRLDLHVFVKNRRRAWGHDVVELIDKHFRRLDAGAHLDLRLDAEEWIEPLEVEAQPPPLTKFLGKYRDLDELPLPADEQEEEQDERRAADGSIRPPTPTLDRIGVNLGALARDGELERAHERKAELDELFGLVSGKRRQAIAVVGSTGVGKSTILNELAHRVAHEAKDPKAARPVFFVDASRLVAGDNWFGDWQRQTLDVLEECEAADVVWFVGNLLPLLDAGKNIASEQNVALLMKPALAGRRVTVVGECSTAGWTQLSLKDAGFAQLFTIFRVEEPGEAETARILKGVARDFHKKHRMTIRQDAIEAATELSKRYASQSSALGAAAHLLRRVADAAAADGRTRLDRSAVVKHFCAETGMPAFLVRDELPLPIDKIEAAFESRLVGQSHAVSLMTSLVTIIKAGLSDLGRPLGSFMFVGPTGVGKTETAKALAAFLFASEQRLTRFDMSEFSGWDAVHRFLGRQDQEGKLVAAVRRRPFSVVLLDEIEKAAPEVFDVLLQVLGEARLTDEAGRTADFRNVVIVMTSNLGVDTLRRSVGFQSEDAIDRYRGHFLTEAQKFFRPELFNRIDHIVPFLPLGATAIQAITRRELTKFKRREGLRQRDIRVEVAAEAMDWLAARGVDERYGARPLKRVIEQQLTARLARQLADGLPDNARSVVVERHEDSLAFDVKVGKGKATTDAAALTELVTRVQNLRFRHRCWSRTQTYREAEQRLRLLDRLSQNKRFWDNKALAEERLAGVEADRDLVEALGRIGRQIDTLDDLSHDAFFSRDTSNIEDLTAECREAKRRLSGQELVLHGRGLSTTDAVTVFLTHGNNAGRWLERLVLTYAELARHRGWQFSLNLLWQEVEAPEPPAPAPPTSAKKAGTKKKGKKSRRREDADGEAEKPKPKKEVKKKRKKSVLKWRHDRPTRLDFEEEDEDSLRRVVAKALTHREADDVVVLTVEGHHAATMLLDEAGQHQRLQGDGMWTAMVRTKPGIDRAAPDPEFLRTALVKTRVVDERRNLVEDLMLGLHYPLEPRIWRVYERIMLARPVKRAFGDQGIQWLRAWEND